jgi:hypothetical protein
MSVERRTRLREIVRWLGRGYLAYHILAASLMIFWFFVGSRPGYWREPGALSELAFMIFLYPLAIPALVMCGGPHVCGSGESPLTVFSVPVLMLTLIAAGSGIRLAFHFLRRGFKPRESGTV